MRILRIAGRSWGIHNCRMNTGKLHHSLGKTGIRVPELIFGTSALGNLYRELNGTSKEQIVQGWFKAIPSGGRNQPLSPGSGRTCTMTRCSPSVTKECWEQGNALLGEGCRAELLSVHDPDEYLAAAASETDRTERFQDIREAYRALEDLKRSGDAAAIGIGSKDWRVIREVLEKLEVDWHSWTPDDLKPYLDTAFEAFGARRLIFGSDWPVCLLASIYRK